MKTPHQEHNATSDKVQSSEADALLVPVPAAPIGHEETAKHFPVVAIGASAGGLEALKTFFTAMPADSGMAFVVIVHLDPVHESHLPTILSQYTTMGVSQVLDGDCLAANHVYLIPPNHLLSVKNAYLHLEVPIARPGISLPIDHFFSSLAQDQQERSIAIILSGTGSDGTCGLKEIKAAGGLVIVQQPETAGYEGMPRSAAATGLVDVLLAPDAMPQALLDFVEHADLRGEHQELLEGVNPLEHIDNVLTLLRLKGGYDFRCYKKGMLLRRIQRRMGLTHLTSLEKYSQHVRNSPEELKALAQDLLISVTSFFREPEAWKLLAAEVIPSLLAAKPPNAGVRVWVTGCASGEEAYSIGMLLLEQRDSYPHCGKIQIFATDIDKLALEIARLGLYPESISTSLSPQRLSRFFLKTDKGYQVKTELRELMTFAPQNLVMDAPFSRLDLICCRNLLIYLEPDLQQKVIGLFRFALNPGGFLFMGKSETIGQSRGLFDCVSKLWRIYRRSEPGRETRVHIPLMAGYRAEIRGAMPLQRPRGTDNYGEWLGNWLLQRHAPTSVLINRDYQVLYFHGPTDDYLTQPSGAPTDDLLALAREGLRMKLRTGLHQAMDKDGEVSVKAEVRRNGVSSCVQLTMTPVKDPKGDGTLCVVTFKPYQPELTQEPIPRGMEESEAIAFLETELSKVKHELENSIEDLEASNEELKVSNEEALSMNEELQSSNEELETSKEELQSLNEELTTVNNQLEEKIAELENNNNDLSNLICTTNVATLFLDRNFYIKRYTPACTKLFKLIPSDINRPITDIVSHCCDADMMADAEQVLETKASIEREVSATSGEWYVRKILPYRTANGRIEGIVITFADITAIKRAALQLERLATVVRDSNDAIILFDFQGRIIAWNHAAELMYGYSESAALQLNIDALVPEKHRAEQSEVIQRVHDGEDLKSYELQRLTQEGRILDVWITLSLLRDEAGAAMAIATTERDVTKKNQARQALKNRELRFRQLADTNVIGVMFVANATGKLLNANDAFLDIVGYTRTELSTGQLRLEDLTPAEYLSLEQQAIKEVFSQGACAPYEKEYLRKDGSRVPVLTGCALVKTNPDEYICFVIDLSASKRLEHALREHTQVLIQSNRRKDEFLAMLAHELRNPLVPVLNAVQILENPGGDDPERVLWASAMIKRQVGLLAHLVNDLLDIARIDQGRISLEKNPTDLVSVIAQTVDSCRPSIQARRQALSLSLPNEPLWVEADEDRLSQVVGNLVDNACKYTPEGGRIEVSLSREQDEAVLYVHDTGIGMDESMLSQAFELFSQAERSIDRVKGGLGIGLALVKRLVELHGGHVAASSAGINQGSEFIVRLPTLNSDTVPSAIQPPISPASSHSRRILLVEDNLDIASSFTLLLEAMGHAVKTVDNGAAALEAASEFLPEVAFLDIGLPGMDGYELARRLRLDPRFAALKLVALTGYAAEGDKEKCRQAGFDKHLSKPAAIEEIERLLAML